MRSAFLIGLGFLAAVAIPLSPAAGQSVEGRVLDPEGQAIADASVTFRLESRRVIARVGTNDDGLFQIRVIDPGEYFVFVERLGYETTQSILSLREGDTVVVEFRLAVEAIPLDPITVLASPRPEWEHLQPPAMWEFWERKEHMEKLGLGRFFTQKDIAPYGGQKAAQTVSDLAPFFHPEAHEERVTSFWVKGRIGCDPPLFLDGHLIPWTPKGYPHDPLDKWPPVLDDWIHPSEIAAVEIYRGASDVPGEYNVPGSNCGVVAVWSRRGVGSE